jgi:hypothetical protein
MNSPPVSVVASFGLEYGYDPLVDFLQHQRAHLVNQTFALTATLSALPPAYCYTAGIAITAESPRRSIDRPGTPSVLAHHEGDVRPQ